MSAIESPKLMIDLKRDSELAVARKRVEDKKKVTSFFNNGGDAM